MDAFNELIFEICLEEKIRCEDLSFGWMLRLIKNNRSKHIVGRHFDLNPAAADRIACDKYACHILLKREGIPSVEHELFFDPLRRTNWISDDGELMRAFRLFESYGERAVVKPNCGWQGRGVEFCETKKEFERALLSIFKSEAGACVCPFYEIPREYRVFFVNGKCPVVYGKEPASDGWKHNLSAGAKTVDVGDKILLNELKKLAARAADCIGIKFATADIAGLADGTLAVMEINAGVTATKLLEQRPEKRGTVKEVYAEAVRAMFE